MDQRSCNWAGEHLLAWMMICFTESSEFYSNLVRPKPGQLDGCPLPDKANRTRSLVLQRDDFEISKGVKSIATKLSQVHNRKIYSFILTVIPGCLGLQQRILRRNLGSSFQSTFHFLQHPPSSHQSHRQ